MYIKLSVVRNIFKLTSHRHPRPVLIQLWHVTLTTEVPLLGQQQAAVGWALAAALNTPGWLSPQHGLLAHATPACEERPARGFRVCWGLCSVLRMG